MLLIQVPRELVRDSARELAKSRGWKRHPCSSLKELIYGLNTIFDRYKLIKYRHGFPQPSVAARELERIHASCKHAERSRDCARLMARMEVLKERDTDSYRLLLFQAALKIDKQAPEPAIIDGRAYALLHTLALNQPRQLAAMSDQALKELRGLTRLGRGGNRNRGTQSEQDLIQELGILFEKITQQRPGVTFKASDSTYSGSFVSFATGVFKALGLRTHGRKIYRRRKTLKDKSQTT
jgi:hypothetical protein